jgi:hypothetical protein
VVADLEEIDRRQEPAIDEEPLHRLARVTGEECGEGAVPDDHHDRAVVDVLSGDRSDRIGLGWVHDLHRRRWAERERLAGARDGHCEVRIGGDVRDEGVVGRVLKRDGGIEESADPESVDHVHQPGDVVLVCVRQDHHIEVPIEERQVLAEPA